MEKGILILSFSFLINKSIQLRIISYSGFVEKLNISIFTLEAALSKFVEKKAEVKIIIVIE